MAQRLGTVCRDARKTAGLSLMDIAITAGVSQSTVGLFEIGDGGWRWKTDEIVAAYEKECDLPPGELWRRAVSNHD